MDVNLLRSWGIAVSAAAIAGALALAHMNANAASANEDRLTPLREAPTDGAFQLAQAQIAQSEGPSAGEVAFIVRFRGSGPLAQAQAQAARGREAQARRAARAALPRQRAFEGLCFDRYTVGGAETVLRACAPVPAAERAQFQQRWLSRLRAMRAVAYVDANTGGAQARTQ